MSYSEVLGDPPHDRWSVLFPPISVTPKSVMNTPLPGPSCDTSHSTANQHSQPIHKHFEAPPSCWPLCRGGQQDGLPQEPVAREAARARLEAGLGDQTAAVFLSVGVGW